mmetsp:Transcript_2430/g.3548  ORF Transcript_2430/g.3548 Transcript_2430/m.3548 type:complete len:356 (-) Transcript_2430:66-1133(-)
MFKFITLLCLWPHLGRGFVPLYTKQLTMSSGDSSKAVYKVIFIRHGQSTWNKANRFIGWTDSNLTKTGEIEARVAGKLLLAEGHKFDVVFTSLLKRSIKTAWVVLDELNLQHIPVISDWRLNERCYGALVGRNKKECVRTYGEDQVKVWRRSFSVRPPPISEDSNLWPGNIPKYNFLERKFIPKTESLEDTMKRSVYYWNNTIQPVVRKGKHVCICGHENNLRSLFKHLDQVSDDNIRHVEIPRAVPLVYYFDENFKPIKQSNSAPYLSGSYLGEAEEIEAIQKRDLATVYDLSTDEDKEKNDVRFATKLGSLLQPLENDEIDSEKLESDDQCSGQDLHKNPLLLFGKIISNGKN